ncbi:hypothetical protein [Paracoccus aminophilus]|uniref:hypothetical protein n=1 Tax=Paracoccus aminophilus TaxID=34003 RepID=UPI00041BFD3E|nr:hypothetical protein [Paracoccus aminophilus]
MVIHDEIDDLIEAYHPEPDHEAAAEAYVDAVGYLLWAAEMASMGKLQDGPMSRATLLQAARRSLEDAERAELMALNAIHQSTTPIIAKVAAGA